MLKTAYTNFEPVEGASSLSASRPLLLCFSHLRWNFVYQRPQHLLSRAARDYDVYFIEEPVQEDIDAPRLYESLQPDGVTVAVPILPSGTDGLKATRMQRRLIDELVTREAPRTTVCWYYTPMALPFSRHIPAHCRVYDNMDELAAFKGAPPRLLALERELFRHVDIVFTGGQSLYEAKRDRHACVHAFPSSIDATHFMRARRPRADVPDQAHVPHPRLGFFGVIDERMDIDLVGRLADLRPDWQFVMIGPVVKIDPATLPRRANLHWLGGKDYKALPGYLAHWDVGIMPFALNEATRFISPTKTPEFLAAGVPVISTPINDVVRPYGELGLVEIADSAERFVERAEALLRRPKAPWLAEVDRHLATMSWDQTWASMDAHLRARLEHDETASKHTSLVEVARV